MKTVNYAALQTELADVLTKLQSSEVSIDESIKLYEQGMGLVKQLEDYLKTAENNVTKLKAQFDKPPEA